MASVSGLSSLLGKSSITDHDEALTIADAALKSAKSDSDKVTAQRTKIVALLNLERYDDVLRVLADSGAKLEGHCTLEKAYALYKTGELKEAEALLKKTPGPEAGRALKHIAAQVAYRAEKFGEAADLYDALILELLENPDEENDLKINQLATHAQLEWAGKGDLVPEKSKQPVREDLEAFETAYNAGCGCVARGDLAKANILLKGARDLCEAAEYLSAEEKSTELVPILMQQAYVSSQLGNLKEAATLQSAIEDSDIPDGSSRVVAQCNALIFQGLSNPFLVERHYDLLPEASSGNDQLFQHQAVIAMRNKMVVRLNAFKYDGIKETTKETICKDATPSISAETAGLGSINAVAVAGLKTGKAALKKLLPVSETRSYDVGLHLTVIQLYIQAKNFDMAIDILRKLFSHIETADSTDHEDVRYAPGLVALAVTLYRHLGRRKDVRTELARAASHWQKKSEPSSTTLLREAGIELLNSSNPSDLATAGAAFEKIASQNPNDKAATAGLVASFATSDYAKVEPYLSHLTPIDKLIAGVDVNALLEAGVPSFPVSESKQASKKRRLDDDAEADFGKPKNKKTKLPKNADPNVPPDPERWLPLRDRSTYKPKNKKGKKRVADSTQGGMPVSKQDEGETVPLVGGSTVKVEKMNPGKKGKRRGKN